MILEIFHKGKLLHEVEIDDTMQMQHIEFAFRVQSKPKPDIEMPVERGRGYKPRLSHEPKVVSGMGIVRDLPKVIAKKKDGAERRTNKGKKLMRDIPRARIPVMDNIKFERPKADYSNKSFV